MFLDATGFQPTHTERAQICVFGSGPAGTTLANKLAEQNFDVLLVEAGGLEFDDNSQMLYKGETQGDEYYQLDTARLRYFGGTSGHWAGYCRPLDAHDYSVHPKVPHTGWPIGLNDVSPYLSEAAKIVEISDRFEDRPIGPNLVRTVFHQSPPVQFGEKYRDSIEASKNIRCVLNTSLTNMSGEGNRIKSAEVLTEGGGTWNIEADYFAVCLGGIENSRLLMWINEQNNRALIKNHDIIGRYWMEHPTVSVAEALVFRSQSDLFTDGQAYFALSGAHQKANDFMNVSFDTDELAYHDRTKKMIADILCVAPALGDRLMSMFDKNLVCGARLHAQYEQAPDPDNRVMLSDTKDRLGIPTTVLKWEKKDADRRTIVNAAKAIAQEFADQDVGRVRLLDWVLDDSMPIPVEAVLASWHHMGGTRMSETPETGTVDSDLRVHDLDNLYMGGSSVFATSGYANPTLTIVQLSLRLADHLTTRMRG